MTQAGLAAASGDAAAPGTVGTGGAEGTAAAPAPAAPAASAATPGSGEAEAEVAEQKPNVAEEIRTDMVHFRKRIEHDFSENVWKKVRVRETVSGANWCAPHSEKQNAHVCTQCHEVLFSKDQIFPLGTAVR